MTENCDVIVILLIYGEFGAIRKPNSGHRFSLIVTFYLTKTENKTKKSLTQLSHYFFEQRYYFSQKMLIYWKKALTSEKLRGP